MSVARFNMSHGDHESHAAAMKEVRKASKEVKRPVAVLQDLAGPKIRIGDFETETVTLTNRKHLTLTTNKCIGNEEYVYVNYKKLPKEVEKGMTIFLDDGRVHLEVEKIDTTDIITRVVNGGTIRGRRGVNVPDGNLSVSAITAKDKKDIAFGLKQGVDYITLSFVRSAKDVQQLKKLLGKDSNVTIVAKIETKTAIDNLEAIIDEADVIMVARGDLAIEMPTEQVPFLQKRIIRAANRAGKPVITATQMLDSMRTSLVPTRAEVNDVANAILDGSDAVMLSDETAVGKFPAEAVRVMTDVSLTTENDQLFLDQHHVWDFSPVTVCDAVSRSISKAVRTTDARAVVAFSESGHTGRMVARHRPNVPILVLTPHQKTFHRSLVTYACEPVMVHRVKHVDDARRISRKILKERGLAKDGDCFIMGAGIPFGSSGATNMMLIEKM
jgi:pyruvate kinase